jgi:hypothetical protein
MLAAGLAALLGAVGLAFVWKVPDLAKSAFESPFYEAYLPYAAAAGVLALGGSLLSLWLARRRTTLAIMALAAAGFLTSQALMLGHEPVGRYAAGYAHVPAVLAELTPQTPIYAVGRYEQVLPFYLRRTVILVEHSDEMEFGLEQEPQLWIAKREDFVAKWTADHARGRKAVAIMRPDIYTELQQMGLPMHIIAQDPRRVIVTNDVNGKTAP